MIVEKKQYRILIETMVFPIVALSAVVLIGASPLIPAIIQEYNISRGEVSLVISLVPVAVAIFTIPAGILARKIGVKNTFAIGAILQGAGILTPFCSNFMLFLGTRVLLGLGGALTLPIWGAIVMQWFDHREMPLVNGLNACAPNAGNALTYFITIPIANAFGSWRAPLILYSAVALAFGVAWLILGKDKSIAEVPINVRNTNIPHPGLRQIMRQRTTLLIAGCMLGPFCLNMSMSSWLPTYYHEVFAISLATSSSMMATRSLVGIPTGIIGGLLPMRTGLRKPFIVIPGILVGFFALATFLFNNNIVIVTSIFLLGVSLSLYQPSIYTTVMELNSSAPTAVPVILGTAQTVGHFGSFVGPLLVGSLADRTGSYLPGLITVSVLSWSIFVFGRFLPETGPRGKKNIKELQPGKG